MRHWTASGRFRFAVNSRSFSCTRLIMTSASLADVIIKRVQEKLRELTAIRNLPVAVQCRIGHAFSDNPPETAEEFLRIADEQMQGIRTSQTK